MTAIAGHILIVDDYPMSGMKIARAVQELGHTSERAANGLEALALLRAGPYDLVLLDILMPEMDGYETLAAMKADPQLQEIPVIVISSEQEDMDSVTRCIALGALDYLPKLFDPILLAARLNAALEKKRIRDQELEYLQQVERLTKAAELIENKQFETEMLDAVSNRPDALGQLARVIQHMAQEVYARERRLEQQLARLRLDVAEMRRAQEQPLTVYVPMDRRYALADGRSLPERTTGAVLFADISGFTPLTLTLLRELGHRRGIEELPRHTDQIFETLISQVHQFGGSVIGFSGDAITCWFDDLRPTGVPGLRLAVACALAMQQALLPVATRTTYEGTTFTLSVKVTVAAGSIRRFLVGAPEDSVLEVIAGNVLHTLALGEKLAQPGEVVVAEGIVAELARDTEVEVVEWREAGANRFAVVTAISRLVPRYVWPELGAGALTDSQLRPWLRPALYERMMAGSRQFMAELRLTVSLFVRFGEIDFEADDGAREKLDTFIRWVQTLVRRSKGMLVDLTIGDKGSYLFVVFGSPVAHADDSTNAVATALALLQEKPASLDFITQLQIGLTQGVARTGSFGAANRRAYSVFGDKVNLAARLMMAAPANSILGDQSIFEATEPVFEWTTLHPIQVKGQTAPVAVYRPVGSRPAPAAVASESGNQTLTSQLDALPAGSQLALKVASVLGATFAETDLMAVLSLEDDQAEAHYLAPLIAASLLVHSDSDGCLQFAGEDVRQTVYQSLLYAQRRHLHRQVASWLAQQPQTNSAAHARLAHHWQGAGESERAVDYLERAGQYALIEGDVTRAEQYIRRALALERNESPALPS